MSATFRLLALAALLPVVYSRTFVQRIERHRIQSPKGLRGANRADRLHRNLRLKTGSQPFIDDYDDFYLGNITIGTSNQVFTLVLDTGSSNLWVIDCACRGQNCKGDPNSGGYLGADVVDFGGELVDLGQTFGIATTLSDDFAPNDGILGLGWPSISVDNVQPPVFQILKQLDQPLFTVWLDRHANPSINVPGGLITYGAVDTQNCDAQVDYVPLTSEAWWQFQSVGFAVGKLNFPGKQQVISDTGTSWINLLTPHFEALLDEAGAQLNYEYSVYTVDCDAKNLPDIVLTIGGKKYNIPSSEYVIDLNIGGNQCALAASDAGYTSPFEQPAIILGDVFVRAYCNVYDVGQKRIGFAKAHHKEV